MRHFLQSRTFDWLTIVLFSLGFSLYLFVQVKPYSEYVDTLDNVKIAYNLAKYQRFSASNIHGELTTTENDTLSLFVPGSERVVTPEAAMPTAVREPLPVWINCLLMRKFHLLKQYANVEQLNAGKPLMLLKSQNFFYLCAMFVALALLLRSWPAPVLWQLTATILLFYLVCQHLSERMYVLLCTELLACVLMLWCCVFLIRALRCQRLPDWGLAGILLGLLILTKAAFLYIGTALMVALLYFTWQRQRQAGQRGVILMAVMTILVVMPWMLRNLQSLQFFGISERAADVLLVRAEKNLMTPLERKGAICIYTTNLDLKRFCARTFGLDERDLLPTGRLARLVRGHPQDLQARQNLDVAHTISYYYHATTLAYKARVEAYQQQRSMLEANRQTQRMAMQLIMQHPLQHLQATWLFAYRGLNVQHADMVTFAGFFALLALGVSGVRSRDPAAFVLACLPTLMFLFYALCSHFIPRYADPLIPFWLLGLIVLLIKGKPWTVLQKKAHYSAKRWHG